MVGGGSKEAESRTEQSKKEKKEETGRGVQGGAGGVHPRRTVNEREVECRERGRGRHLNASALRAGTSAQSSATTSRVEGGQNYHDDFAVLGWPPPSLGPPRVTSPQARNEPPQGAHLPALL
jgi:hypothetical protein